MSLETSTHGPLAHGASVLISVVIPAYFGEKTIQRTILSVLNQDFNSYEIIVVDDGSIDRTLKKVGEIKSEKIRVIRHKRNLGLAASLNNGIDASRGQFILTLHQDCELLASDWLRRALEVMQKDSKIGALTGIPLFPIDEFSTFEKGFMIINRHNMDYSSQRVEVAFVENKCDLYRKELLKLAGGFASDRFRISAEDQFLSSKIRRLGYKLIRDGALHYRQKYGLSIRTPLGCLKKIFTFGKTQAGILFYEKSSALSWMLNSKDIVTRTLNRFTMLVVSSLVLLSLILFFISPNPFYLLATYMLMVGRFLHYIYLSAASGLGLSIPQVLAISFLGIVSDFTYGLGFLFGLVSSILGRRL